jgi:hypothetical protein
MPEPQPVFTAGQIASRAGLTKRRALQLLAGVVPDGQRTVRDRTGREVPAQAWRVDSLPGPLFRHLDAARLPLRFRSVADYLASTSEPWRPTKDGQPVAWIDLAEACQQRAASRCQALRPLLETMFDQPEATSRLAGLEHAAARDLRCSLAQVRRWVNRVLARDGGREAFDVVELYLDEKLALKTPAGETQAVVLVQLPAAIQDAVRELDSPLKPTVADRYDLWKHLLTEGALIEQRWDDRKTRGQALRQLIERVLKAVPGLARNTTAALRAYYDKRKAVLSGGSLAVLEDRRALDSGNHRRPDFKEDERQIAALAVQHGGRESLAQRRAFRRGLLSPEYVNYYGLDRKLDKGAVPRAVRENITRKVASLEDIHHGRRANALNRAAIRRDWSDCAPGDWFTSDDCTLPIYFKVRNAAGEVVITRGQFLPLMDEKTNFILHWLLLPRRSYTALDIRRLVLKTHDKYGLPHFGFYFEQGIWKARLIDGDKRSHQFKWRDTERMLTAAPGLDAITFANADAVETGLNDPRLGTAVSHAKLPRAKSVEGIFSILQSLMEPEPCYVGRNEMVEKFEDTQQLLREARGGLRHALEKLPWLDEWAPRLDAIVEEYNDTPQPGSRKIPGLKPIDAFESGMAKQPLRKLPAEMRYLLSTHRKEAVVGKDGIRVSISGKPMWYSATGAGIGEGEKVVAYWDIEDRAQIYCTRLDGSEPFVARLLEAPSKTATKEEQAAMRAIQREHVGAVRDEYSQLKPYFLRTIARDEDFSRRDREMGAEIEAGKEAVGRQRREQAASKRKAADIARQIGAVLPQQHPNMDRVRRSLELEQTILSRRQPIEGQSA